MTSRPYLRLCSVLAGSDQSDLRRQIQFLKAENGVLRARIEGPVDEPAVVVAAIDGRPRR